MATSVGTTLIVVAVAFGGHVAQHSSTKRLPARSAEWHCQSEQKWSCELPGGCERLDSSRVWLLVNFEKSTYQRCDRSGCDSYGMDVSEKGLFTYIRLPEHPDMFMKIGLGDLFTEVVAQGVSTLNSFGTCKPHVP